MARPHALGGEWTLDLAAPAQDAAASWAWPKGRHWPMGPGPRPGPRGQIPRLERYPARETAYGTGPQWGPQALTQWQKKTTRLQLWPGTEEHQHHPHRLHPAAGHAAHGQPLRVPLRPQIAAVPAGSMDIRVSPSEQVEVTWLQHLSPWQCRIQNMGNKEHPARSAQSHSSSILYVQGREEMSTNCGPKSS